MGKMLVDIESINIFRENIISENNKLLEVINEMYEDSIKYERMVDNKSGNLYKEVMLRELQKEKETIINNNETLQKLFTEISSIYKSAVDETQKSVGA